MGVRINPGDCGAGSCSLFIAIDENRDDTYENPFQTFGDEDRGFIVTWTEPGISLPVVQLVGLPLQLAAAGQKWDTEAAVGYDASTGVCDIEVRIELPALGARPDVGPRTTQFGLAIGLARERYYGKRQSALYI